MITLTEISAAVEGQGYKVVEKRKTRFMLIAGTLVIIIALFILFRIFSTSSLAAAFPVARTGMGYGMVLVIGLLTSVHCIAMCGGINLSQTLRKGIRDGKKGNGEWGVGSRDQGSGTGDQGTGNRDRYSDYDNASRLHLVSEHNPRSPIPSPRSPFYNPQSLLLPAVLYNSGRLISYTAVGIIVGALGSVITLSGRFQGAVLLLAGIFMLVMGINMLGLFPVLRRIVPRMPKIFSQKINSLVSSPSPIPSPRSPVPSPLLVGFLNGFMPCGPLQAMQLYALSTGSPVRGGISMFLFCLGTIPLMFALGAVSGILSGSKGQVFSRRVMYAGAVLVAAMGLAMLNNGWNLAGIGNPLNRAIAGSNSTGQPVIQNGVQIVNSTLQPGRYPAIVVQQGIPVRWIINAPQGSINGCNNRFIVREYGIQHSFTPGENIIEFLPEKTGRFPYSCWMGMIRSSITVLAEGESVASAQETDINPKPAGADIPTDEIAFARIMEGFQAVTIQLNDDGFEPAIVVMQRQIPALWTINIESFDPGNSLIVFPAYFTRIETVQGENQIQLFPTVDFDFSTGDNVFYGYVKVVNDINNVDEDELREEVANHETLIYPDGYFEMGRY
jgi:sulfite exporter TauE/SafE/plastocyanin domain-containing protein